MKNALGSSLLLAAIVGLSGCGPASYEVSASCESSKQDLPLYQRILRLASSEIPDAADFVIDISGSSVAFPGMGVTTLRLVDEATGAEVAAREFVWVRAGNTLRLNDPSAVNAWVATDGGSATALRYSMGQIDVGASPGPNRISVASQYKGVNRAAASSDFVACTIYASPYPCRR